MDVMESKRRWLKVTCMVWGGDFTYDIFADPDSVSDIHDRFRDRGGFSWYCPMGILKVKRIKNAKNQTV